MSPDIPRMSQFESERLAKEREGRAAATDKAMADVMATHITMLRGAIELAVEKSPADAVSMIAEYFEECGVEDDETRALIDSWYVKTARAGMAPPDKPFQHPVLDSAFPRNTDDVPGMSLRDYFAAKAMQALIITPSDLEDDFLWKEKAAVAYKMADAMLAAREQQDAL